jgi:TatD DNase family protein
MLTDTHCHLDFNKFDEDRETVIQRAVEAGVSRILIPALEHESSLSAIKLAESHPPVFAAVGFHPTDLDKFSKRAFDEVKQFASHPKVVAIGEIGIDYYWVKDHEARAFQLEALQQQLTFAAAINKPVIIHMREQDDAWLGQASLDLLRILSEWHRELEAQDHPLAEKPGVLHSFNGNLEMAQKALALHFYIGVTGPVTYKNAEEKRNIIKQIPLTQLLIETDAPFLTPVPHRGKRNEPAFVRYIADKIAEIHKTTREQVAKITARNAAHLFGWEADA